MQTELCAAASRNDTDSSHWRTDRPYRKDNVVGTEGCVRVLLRLWQIIVEHLGLLPEERHLIGIELIGRTNFLHSAGDCV